jgi:thymidylate kinase
MLAVLGADGTGKSTLITKILPVLEAAVHGHVYVRHLRPRLLPALARLRGDPNADAPVADPHARQPSGVLGSLLRLVYYTLDYPLGYWTAVYPSLVKRPCIWIFDRYFHDFLLDPLRLRIALPKWIVRCVAVAVPKPDIVLCLGAQPDTIRKRKPELPPEELNRQMALLQEICRRNRYAVWIDAGGSADDTADHVLGAVVKWASARYQGS